MGRGSPKSKSSSTSLTSSGRTPGSPLASAGLDASSLSAAVRTDPPLAASVGAPSGSIPANTSASVRGPSASTVTVPGVFSVPPVALAAAPRMTPPASVATPAPFTERS